MLLLVEPQFAGLNVVIGKCDVGIVGPAAAGGASGPRGAACVLMLKAEAWPLSGEVPHWQAESRLFRADARRRFIPSMRQRIDLTSIYRQALRGLPGAIDGQAPLPVPDVCPVTLDELLSER
jgi:hypothetical protein